MTQNRGRSAQSPGAVSDASVRANHRSLVRISQEVLALAETFSRFDETSCCSAERGVWEWGKSVSACRPGNLAPGTSP